MRPIQNPKSRNLTFLKTGVSREDRIRISGQKSAVLWFTGLSGSGKSTVANAVETRLNAAGRLTTLLDGDNVRHGLCADLGFSVADRHENIRRIAHLSRLFWEANVITLVSFISPFRAERRMARKLVGTDFIEIFVDAPLAVCEKRDPKGLYKKARGGKIPEFTGISSPYEAPKNPEIILRTGEESPDVSVKKIMGYLVANGYIGV